MRAEGPASGRVAVLLSTYNGERYLPEQLGSLLAQTHRDWALLWRDDGSEDGSAAVVRDFAAEAAGGRCTEAAIAGRLGPRESFFALLRAALAGDFSGFAFADQDDVWLPRKLAAGLAALADPARHESYASILRRAGRDELTVTAAAPPPAELEAWSMHSHGAMFCEVRVNAVTGEIRVSRFLGSFDCGRILNAKTASSQFRGGIIMGLGLALMEETRFDERKGRVMNPSLWDYHVPVHLDVPEIDVIWTDIPDPRAPMGARGIGEIGITGTAAAVANAVYNATGRRVRDLPLTPEKLL
jgi:xanthine dehydrogenase YagR molybdenum-binding subunit